MKKLFAAAIIMSALANGPAGAETPRTLSDVCDLARSRILLFSGSMLSLEELSRTATDPEQKRRGFGYTNDSAPTLANWMQIYNGLNCPPLKPSDRIP